MQVWMGIHGVPLEVRGDELCLQEIVAKLEGDFSKDLPTVTVMG